MSAPVSLSLFTEYELVEMKNAVKAEAITRITGKVNNSNVAGQSYGLQLMTNDELAALSEALAERLGLTTDNDATRGRPDFSRGGIPIGRGNF
jgi:hypothetical protein